MNRFLLLPLLALFATGCGGGSSDVATPGADAPEAAPTEASAPEASTPSGTAPDGSVGAYTLRFAEGDADDAPASEVSGFLPAPVPRDAVTLTDLDAVPSYHIGVEASSLPADYELNGTYFLFVQAGEDGRNKVSLLRGHVGLSNNFQDTYTGSIAALTFPPLWDASASGPMLTLDRMGDEDGQVATTPLAVLSERPAWAQPVGLPALNEGQDYTVTAEMEVADEALMLYLLYRDDNGWEMEDFRPNRSETRRRDREGDTRATAPYLVYPEDMNASTPEAYILAFRL